MKFLFTLFAYILCINAYANTNWIYFTTSSNDSVFFIEINSIQKSGDSMTYWYRRNFPKRNASGDLSSKVQSTINCRTREIINRYIMTYDDINNNGKLTHSFNPNELWEPIAPDTINWEFFKYVCK